MSETASELRKVSQYPLATFNPSPKFCLSSEIRKSDTLQNHFRWEFHFKSHFSNTLESFEWFARFSCVHVAHSPANWMRSEMLVERDRIRRRKQANFRHSNGKLNADWSPAVRWPHPLPALAKRNGFSALSVHESLGEYQPKTIPPSDATRLGRAHPTRTHTSNTHIQRTQIGAAPTGSGSASHMKRTRRSGIHSNSFI